ncbi:glycoside hydrolase family 30 protein [Sphingobacterium deserti]|uniref:O-glycosyl hydrolase, family 30 n=1 Tax=Sphingobacterium deserti TaxID=1229276 RepID=A0A0B8T712_9SPHI|nr:hypothetical protein [Sphingobacterium deserti]KGE13320.1 O-glycosyl hydrolase, family 30 [Sphingobacterium deserti]
MKNIKFKLALIIFGFTFQAVKGQAVKVHYVDLRDNAAVERVPLKAFHSDSVGKAQERIVVHPDIRFQTINGVGGAFNEIGGEALMTLSADKREILMEGLFSEKAGAGFSFCRTAIGASDFGIDAYSYSETAEDYHMEKFSIDREKRSVIPYLQLAFKQNPNLKMFASPWSPPGWMKYSGLMDKGIDAGKKNRLIDDKKIYDAYALYFLKYVKAYAQEGVSIDRILIQNEQDLNTNYPSCNMPVEQMVTLVQQHIHPLFQKNKLKTELWAGTFRAADGAIDGVQFMSEPAHFKGFDGVGIQYTNGRFISDMKALNPQMDIMHTESDCYNGDNSMEQARKRFDEIASYINAGSENFTYWNMILNETGKSGWNWKQNSLVTIDRGNQQITYNPDYAVMFLMSTYIRPGYVRVAHFAYSNVMTLYNGKNATLFIQNNSNKIQSKECVVGEKTYKFSIPPLSLCAVELL